MSVSILYEDAECLVVYKERGVPVQPDLTGDPDLLTLTAEQSGAPLHPVHRLDRSVTGLVLFAKGAKAAARLSADIRDGRMGKEYIAVCAGAEPPSGELCDLLYHDKRRSKAFVVDRKRAGVKEARLTCHRLSTVEHGGERLHLLHIRLATGRFHQIRVQLASRGAPIVGDGKYGSRRKGALALHAVRLTFCGAAGEVCVSAPPPSDGSFTLFDERSLSL